MQLKKLMNLCTKLVARVTSLETKLKKTKEVHGKALTKLVKKVKRLEDKLKSTNKRKKAKMVISDNEEVLVSEDPSKQERMEETEDTDVEVQSQETFEAELSVLSAAKILTEASKERVKIYNRRRRSTDNSQVSTAVGLFSTAEDIQDTDEELARNVQEEEQTKFDQERKAVDDIDWSKIVEQAQERQSRSMIRYQALKKKPVTVAQARKNMMVYLKNMANYKMKYLKGMSYDQIRPIFEEEYRKVQTLLKKDSEVSKLEKKRVAEEALLQESFKKLRTAKASGSEPFHQEKSTEEPKELSEEDLKKMLEIVLVEEFRVEAL
ncbi:hypothetical protein Tco_0900638 [Tanacetum coccineum]